MCLELPHTENRHDNRAMGMSMHRRTAGLQGGCNCDKCLNGTLQAGHMLPGSAMLYPTHFI
jgi:hypothetical protein